MDDYSQLFPYQVDGNTVNNQQLQISAEIPSSAQRKSTLSSFTVYHIKISDKEGQLQTERRYSDFDLVRAQMTLRWPGCIIPALPRKKVIGNNDSTFIEGRRQALEIFVKELAKLKHLWYSKEWQIFLRSTGDLQKVKYRAIQQFKHLPHQTHEDIIKKYDETFPKLVGKEADTIMLAKILQFGSFCKKTLPLLQNYKEIASSFLEARVHHSQQLLLLFNFLLPEYEKSCLSVYCNQLTDGKFIFNEPSDQKLTNLIAKLKELLARPEFQALFKKIEVEEREIEALLQMFKIKESYENKLKEAKIKEKQLVVDQNKLNAGKTNVFQSFLKGNLEEQKKNVSTQLDQSRQDIKAYTFLNDQINLLLGHFEIDRWRQQKIHGYHDVVRGMASLMVQTSQVKQRIYEHVLENHNLM